MKSCMQTVVMAGGNGTRLWPLSRKGFPKQFIPVMGDQSLFQGAIKRLDRLSKSSGDAMDICIVGSDDHRYMILDQLAESGLKTDSVLLEPTARNTAPALTLAALNAVEGGDDPVLVVIPADQVIADEEALLVALQKAVDAAAQGAIVILGITPDRPETGYGYIKAGNSGDDAGPAKVLKFVEKPDLDTARKYLEEGCYSWNSGMFVLKASVWLDALECFRPDIHVAAVQAWNGRTRDGSFVRPDKAAFGQVPAESIDYAVMERCPGSRFDIRMIPLAAGWNDLGAWDAVWQVSGQDAAGNVAIGDVVLQDSHNTLVHASSRLVSVVGLDDVVVVETPDAVMVTDRAHSQDVKKVVARLDQEARTEHVLHRKVHRPWGWYDSIDYGPRFQVKRIMVKPGAALSLQMHHHRAEHWIVVSGTAEVTVGDRKVILTENQSTYIPLGEVHRLINPGKVPLEIIEVQSGSYLGEDDIVRFEDTYGRA